MQTSIQYQHTGCCGAGYVTGLNVPHLGGTRRLKWTVPQFLTECYMHTNLSGQSIWFMVLRRSDNEYIPGAMAGVDPQHLLEEFFADHPELGTVTIGATENNPQYLRSNDHQLVPIVISTKDELGAWVKKSPEYLDTQKAIREEKEKANQYQMDAQKAREAAIDRADAQRREAARGFLNEAESRRRENAAMQAENRARLFANEPVERQQFNPNIVIADERPRSKKQKRARNKAKAALGRATR